MQLSLPLSHTANSLLLKFPLGSDHCTAQIWNRTASAGLSYVICLCCVGLVGIVHCDGINNSRLCLCLCFGGYNNNGDDDSCGQWILISNATLGEVQRCEIVAKRFPEKCGACNPTCETPVPTHAPTVTLKPTLPLTPRPTLPPFEVPHPDSPCGCNACDETVLNNVIFGFSCQERIDYLQTPAGGSLDYLEACVLVSESFENNVCGPAW